MVNFERFKRWCERRFTDVKISGKEIRIHSIFDATDDNYHLWLNPSGGKKKRPFGVYHCFKTDKKGSLASFIQQVDHCDKDDALAILRGEPTIRDLEQQLEEFFKNQVPEVIEPPKPDLELPIGTYLINDVPNKWWKTKAEEYLEKRNIPSDGLYICIEKPYRARIIIPYYDRNGKLIYWNGRHIFPQSKLRYLGPPKEKGVGKGDVVYVPGQWYKSGELVHLCEGEFNAMSLKLSDLNAVACGGKNMTDKQAVLLSNYKLCLCLDRDKAGKIGTTVMSDAISLVQNKNKFVVRPPKPYKDWNEMYVAEGSVIVHHFIKKNMKRIDYQFPYKNDSDWSSFFNY